MEQKYTDQILDLGTKIQDLKKQIVDLRHKAKHTIMSTFESIWSEAELFLPMGAKYEELKQNCLAKTDERRRLYNELIELRGNIRVFCRCRPLNKNEIKNNSKTVVNFESSPEELQVISPKRSFKFDHVFRPEDNQEAVFEQTKPFVTSVLDGFNVCIFAYGRTGSGKTFTMEGTPEQRGVNYRTLEELFRISSERQDEIKYELSVSMLEIYNDKIIDLLAESSSNSELTNTLEIKEAANGTVEVKGLVEADVYETKDVWEKLNSGNLSRSVGSTSANERSSRSHCLLRVTVVGKNLSIDQSTRSHLWLVDLAGSECLRKTNAEGKMLEESKFINISLLALKNVLLKLKSKSPHIPYRSSKLTRILQSSLGGDCKTLMFVHISPSEADLSETHSSLNFAADIRQIKKAPARKQVEKPKPDEKENVPNYLNGKKRRRCNDPQAERPRK